MKVGMEGEDRGGRSGKVKKKKVGGNNKTVPFGYLHQFLAQKTSRQHSVDSLPPTYIVLLLPILLLFLLFHLLVHLSS